MESVLFHVDKTLTIQEQDNLGFKEIRKIFQDDFSNPFLVAYVDDNDINNLIQMMINFYNDKCDKSMALILDLTNKNNLDEIHFIFQHLTYSLKSFNDFRLILKEFNVYFDFSVLAFLIKKICFTFAYYSKNHLKEFLISFEPFEKDYIRYAFYNHYKIIKEELDVYIWPFAENRIQKKTKTISFEEAENELIKMGEFN